MHKTLIFDLQEHVKRVVVMTQVEGWEILCV